MSELLERLQSSCLLQVAVAVAVAGVIIAGMFLADYWQQDSSRVQQTSEPPLLANRVTPTPLPIPSPVATSVAPATPVVAGSMVIAQSNRVGVAARATYVTPTPAADGQVVDLAADLERVGWVNNDPQAVTTVSFPDFNLYAGTLRVVEGGLRDVVYTAALAFDLSALDAFGPATNVELLLFGLSDENQERDQGTWTVELLADDRDFWTAPSFDVLMDAPVALTLTTLDTTALSYNRLVQIPLDAQAVTFLNAMRYQIKSLTVRIRGPMVANSLFGFDGGLGSGSLGNPPRLLVATGPLVATPTPWVITTTPTAETVETAAAHVIEATRLVAEVGTPTPTPFNLVTATPTEEGAPQYWVDPLGTSVPVVVSTATPSNVETESALFREATAIAIATGTPTPLPDRYVTATPTATPLYFIATVTPENVMTLAAELVAATALAATQGTPTPLPTNGVIITPTPRFLVVTSTPTPLNVATAQILAAEATVHYALTGTPTPTPVNQVTATPLPDMIPLSFFTPTPTSSPTLELPPAVPPSFSNKIVFLSDRAGNQDGDVFAIDPVEGIVYSVTEPWVWQLGQEQIGLAPDARFEAVVQPDSNRVLQVHIYSFEYGDTRQLTTFVGDMSYDPAWSPTGERIAFVSAEAGNDEIYTIRADGSDQIRLTFNDWEWDKHPSWSPDGSQIVFWSNRDTGRSQLWIMNAEGTDQRNLSNNEFNDWAPIWIR